MNFDIYTTDQKFGSFYDTSSKIRISGNAN